MSQASYKMVKSEAGCQGPGVDLLQRGIGWDLRSNKIWSWPNWLVGKESLRSYEGTYDLPFIEGSAAVGGSQSGSAFLQVPGFVAILSSAAHRDGVDAVGVAITGAVVPFSPTIPRGPDKDGAQTLAALHGNQNILIDSEGKQLISSCLCAFSNCHCYRRLLSHLG